ncbi:chaperone protein dnaJ 11, chloroplastic [Diospyros lotus]|uniref:chaperone protein dnaJ 11, chloroplastic n=1 Tax=Diospyros lotus TaxID=55363 RepID=UPI0022520A67|nr:chaperone protein dnaJ 11, chloroplastic [Diospyros lotus]
MVGALTFPVGMTLRLSPSAAGTARSGRLTPLIRCGATIQALKIRKASSLYEVLRVERSATAMEIKAAYRSLAKVYHPDAAQSEPSDGRDFIEIHNAYVTLSDPTARALYDLSLSDAAGSRPFAYSRRSPYGSYPTRTWETDQCW